MNATKTSNLKARDVEQIFRKYGPEKGSLLCIQQLADYQTVLFQQNMEMAQMLDSVVNTLGNFIAVAENLKNATEAMKNMDREIPDENGPLSS